MLSLEEIKKEGHRVRQEFNKMIVGYIITAFSLVAGLAWNEAIKSFIEYWFPLSDNTLVAKMVYALIITLMVVVAAIYLKQWFLKEETEEK